MIQTYRFRLYPTSQQESFMAETIETCRHLYNDLLNDRIENRMGAFEQKRLLTAYRKENKYLSRVHSQVLQDVVFRLDKAFGSFFGGLSRFPRFRRNGRYNSFTFPQIGGFKISAILDACWGKTRLLTAYKAERRSGRVILVQPSGTSQECSGCRKTVKKVLSERTHSCPHCGLELDRDVNAARNILASGLELAPVETEPLPVIRIGKFGQGSKKPTALRRG